MRQSWIESFDGTKIGYRLRGEGNKVMVFCNGLSTTESYWKYLIRHYSARCRVLTWDYRGHGASHPPMNPDEISISSHARDLNLILDAEQIEQPVIGGFSMGVQVCREYYRLFPEGCAGLILVAFMVGSYLVCFANRKAGDFLIETEIEMRKVTWPTWKPWLSPKTELWGATYVVIVLMLVIAGFIALVDVALQMIAQLIFYGG